MCIRDRRLQLCGQAQAAARLAGLLSSRCHPRLSVSYTHLLRAVCKHVKCKWSLLYIERWLKAPMELDDGTRVERTKGTPQGGVVSPVLANLFLHYVFDTWMGREYRDLPWCRYADDGLVHCRTAVSYTHLDVYKRQGRTR